MLPCQGAEIKSSSSRVHAFLVVFLSSGATCTYAHICTEGWIKAIIQPTLQPVRYRFVPSFLLQLLMHVLPVSPFNETQHVVGVMLKRGFPLGTLSKPHWPKFPGAGKLVPQPNVATCLPVHLMKIMMIAFMCCHQLSCALLKSYCPGQL